MKKLAVAILFVGIVASPLFAKMWKPDQKVINTQSIEVRGKEADIAVKAAADAVVAQADTGKVKDATAQHLATQIEKYTDQRDLHPGLGFGGIVNLTGEVEADLLMTLRKGNLMGILSVGYGDIYNAVKDNDWSWDKTRLGLGCVYEF